MKQIRYPLAKCGLLLAYAAWVMVFYLCDWPCVYQALFSIPCPGCGMTRAWRAALCGEIATAFAFHPMFWSAPVLLVYFWRDGRLFRRDGVDRVILIAIAVGFLVTWIIKLVQSCVI